MGSDIIYKIKGIGWVRLQMYDGIIKSLIHIWFVLDMKKKLISLGVLVGKSLHATLADLGLTATKCALIHKRNSFYL